MELLSCGRNGRSSGRRRRRVLCEALRSDAIAARRRVVGRLARAVPDPSRPYPFHLLLLLLERFVALARLAHALRFRALPMAQRLAGRATRKQCQLVPSGFVCGMEHGRARTCERRALRG